MQDLPLFASQFNLGHPSAKKLISWDSVQQVAFLRVKSRIKPQRDVKQAKGDRWLTEGRPNPAINCAKDGRTEGRETIALDSMEKFMKIRLPVQNKIHFLQGHRDIRKLSIRQSCEHHQFSLPDGSASLLLMRQNTRPNCVWDIVKNHEESLWMKIRLWIVTYIG